VCLQDAGRRTRAETWGSTVPGVAIVFRENNLLGQGHPRGRIVFNENNLFADLASDTATA
jgi:hypothetical protein